MEEFKLNDGNQIPRIGFGTYKIKGYQGALAISQAIESGYRLLDSAARYENEGALGKAIRSSSVARSQLFVTSKLPGAHHEYKAAINELEEGLLRSGLDYFDLYLIHWAKSFGRPLCRSLAGLDRRAKIWLGPVDWGIEF